MLPDFANAHQVIVENAPSILTIDIFQFAGLACLLMALLFGFWWLFGKISPENWLPVLTYPIGIWRFGISSF